MKLKISMVSGAGLPDDPGVRVLDQGRVTIGRGDDCIWRLPDPERALSKRHCEVAFQGTVFVLKDTSTNGVFVNDAADPVGKGKIVVLKNGDRFRAGDFVFQVAMVGAEIDPFADPVAPSQGQQTLAGDDRRRGGTAFVDPGSPLEAGAFGSGSADPFDAFGSGFDDPAESDAFAARGGDDWADGGGGGEDGGEWGGGDWSDSPSSTSFGASVEAPAFGDDPAFGGGAEDFSAGFDDGGFSQPGPAPAASMTGTAATAPDAGDPFGADHGSDGGREAALAATLVDALFQVSRHHEAIAGRLGIALAKDGLDFPTVSGASLVSRLLRMPGDQGVSILSGLSSAVVAQAETLARTVESGGGQSPVAEGSDEDPFGESSFGADPFA